MNLLYHILLEKESLFFNILRFSREPSVISSLRVKSYIIEGLFQNVGIPITGLGSANSTSIPNFFLR